MKSLLSIVLMLIVSVNVFATEPYQDGNVITYLDEMSTKVEANYDAIQDLDRRVKALEGRQLATTQRVAVAPVSAPAPVFAAPVMASGWVTSSPVFNRCNNPNCPRCRAMSSGLMSSNTDQIVAINGVPVGNFAGGNVMTADGNPQGLRTGQPVRNFGRSFRRCRMVNGVRICN